MLPEDLVRHIEHDVGNPSTELGCIDRPYLSGTCPLGFNHLHQLRWIHDPPVFVEHPGIQCPEIKRADPPAKVFRPKAVVPFKATGIGFPRPVYHSFLGFPRFYKHLVFTRDRLSVDGPGRDLDSKCLEGEMTGRRLSTGHRSTPEMCLHIYPGLGQRHGIQIFAGPFRTSESVAPGLGVALFPRFPSSRPLFCLKAFDGGLLCREKIILHKLRCLIRDCESTSLGGKGCHLTNGSLSSAIPHWSLS